MGHIYTGTAMTSHLLTAKQVAAGLNCNPETIRRWERDGIISATLRQGRVIRYDMDQVNRQLAANAKRKAPKGRQPAAKGMVPTY